MSCATRGAVGLPLRRLGNERGSLLLAHPLGLIPGPDRTGVGSEEPDTVFAILIAFIRVKEHFTPSRMLAMLLVAAVQLLSGDVGLGQNAKCSQRADAFRIASDNRPPTEWRPRPTESYPAVAVGTPDRMRHLRLGQATLDP
jgi:hypothetical protein